MNRRRFLHQASAVATASILFPTWMRAAGDSLARHLAARVDKPSVSVLIGELAQLGNGFHSGTAPGCPEVDEVRFVPGELLYRFAQHPLADL
jgi:hypothetical protein